MPLPFRRRPVGAAAAAAVGLTVWAVAAEPPAKVAAPGAVAFPAARAIVVKYCQDCHSTEAQKGSLDLERFATADAARKHAKVWQGVVEMVEAGEMPPKGKPQPTAGEKRDLLAWARGLLDAAARANAGDPGAVPLRRLSNAEYDCTVRDLTGIDLRPTR